VKALTLVLALGLAACGGGGSSAVVKPVVGPTVYIGDSIMASWPTPAGVVNVGVGGQGSREMLARFQTDVMSHSPSRVVIEAGTNDVGGSVGVEAIQAMAGLAVASGAKVTLMNVMSRNVALPVAIPSIRTAIQLFNNDLLSLCNTYGYTCVDAYRATLATDGSLRSDLTTDGLHMNDAGYAILVKLL
jgi:lysophospholipase L1-like esterase